MAADYGIDVHLDRVPQREEGMEPWEIMISESQERMVAIVAPERLAEVEAVIDRWELHRAVIGEVTETGELRAFWDGDVVGAIPARFLTDDCPRYVVERSRAAGVAEVPLVATARRRRTLLLDLLGSDALRSRAFVTRRYDQLVQSRTVRRPGPRRRGAAAAAVVPRARGHARRHRAASARSTRSPAAQLAILEAARNVACAGGEPLGFTDCLNFGNPEKPEIGWELAESIEGMAQACEALGLPIVSGQRLALQRHRRPLDPSDAGRRLRRARSRRAARARPLARGRRDPARLDRDGRRSPARSCRPATAPSPARRPRSTSPPRRRSSRWSSADRTALLARRTTSPTAASPSRSPRRRSSPASVPGSTSR